MKIAGTYTLTGAREAVWNLLMNPDAIAKALPGVQEMHPIDGECHAWRAVAALEAAALSGVYAGQIRLSELDAPQRCCLMLSGEGRHGTMTSTTRVHLREGDSPAVTVIEWRGEALLSGKLATLEHKLVKLAVGLLARQFFGGLAKQLSAAPPDLGTEPSGC